MSRQMVEAVMSASSWSALVATGLVEDSDRGLRKALRQVHPDMESDPRAGEAFQKVRELREGTHKPKGTLLGGMVSSVLMMVDSYRPTRTQGIQTCA